jgi:hypothetical protein
MRGAFALTRTAVVRSSPAEGVGELQLSSARPTTIGRTAECPKGKWSCPLMIIATKIAALPESGCEP